MPAPTGSVALTVVAPAHDEEANIRPLVMEISAALDPLDLSYEILIVDDASTDRTSDVVREMLAEYPRLRGIQMNPAPSGRSQGQSAALSVGFHAARGDLILMLDADLQNDPADLPSMLRRLQETGADMVQGDRSSARRDNLLRRISSRVARLFRSALLRDTIRDTGCSLRVMRREVAVAFPLEFRGMHRFMPIMARQMGFTVVEVPVHHRPRVAGTTSYGIRNRALPALVDCFAVRWMRSRRQPLTSEPIAETGAPPAQASATIEIVPLGSAQEIARW